MFGDFVLAVCVVVGIFLFIFLTGSGGSPRYRRRAVAVNEEHGTRPTWEREETASLR